MHVVQGAIIDVVSDRNVLIYCNLVTPQLVGSDISRLLRTIICPSQLGIHVFSNIYCLPMEFKIFWIIHINMTILNQLCISVLMIIIQQYPLKWYYTFGARNGKSYHLK